MQPLPRRMLQFIPWGMVLGRAVLGPAIVFLAIRGTDARWLGCCIVIALVDDIADGMLARRWHCDSAALRLSDSLADTIFYLGAALALWLRRPALIRANWPILVVLFSLEAIRYFVDLGKFRRAASYHSWLAKIWGLVLACALVLCMSFAGFGWLIRTAILLGILVNLEGLTMSLLLPRWAHDVRHLPAALRLRREQQLAP